MSRPYYYDGRLLWLGNGTISDEYLCLVFLSFIAVFIHLKTWPNNKFTTSLSVGRRVLANIGVLLNQGGGPAYMNCNRDLRQVFSLFPIDIGSILLRGFILQRKIFANIIYQSIITSVRLCLLYEYWAKFAYKRVRFSINLNHIPSC